MRHFMCRYPVPVETDRLDEWILERAQWNLEDDDEAGVLVDGSGSAAYKCTVAG